MSRSAPDRWPISSRRRESGISARARTLWRTRSPPRYRRCIGPQCWRGSPTRRRLPQAAIPGDHHARAHDIVDVAAPRGQQHAEHGPQALTGAPLRRPLTHGDGGPGQSGRHCTCAFAADLTIEWQIVLRHARFHRLPERGEHIGRRQVVAKTLRRGRTCRNRGSAPLSLLDVGAAARVGLTRRRKIGAARSGSMVKSRLPPSSSSSGLVAWPDSLSSSFSGSSSWTWSASAAEAASAPARVSPCVSRLLRCRSGQRGTH